MDNQSIIYLVISLVMIFIGVYLFARSFFAKKESAPELMQSGEKNIIPRDQRDVLIQDKSSDSLNELGAISPSDSKLATTELVSNDAATADVLPQASLFADAPATEAVTEKTNVDQLGETLSSLEHATADIKPVSDTSTDSSGNLLDAHLQEQELQDHNSALRNAAEVVSLTLLPNQLLNFDGDTVLQILDAYGLKFGEMNLFHRYEEADGSGPLLFSVMRYAEKDGTQPFDLQTLSDETVDGLTFFLPLPHPKASAGIGAMLSMSGSMARDLNATIYDENFELLDRQGRETIREFVTDYKKVV